MALKHFLKAAAIVIGDELSKSTEDKALDKYANMVKQDIDRNSQMHLKCMNTFASQEPLIQGTWTYKLLSMDKVEQICNRKFTDKEKEYILNEFKKYSKFILQLDDGLLWSIDKSFVRLDNDVRKNLYISFREF